MPRTFLPFFPLIIRYPFLKISGAFLENEFGGFEGIFNARNEVVAEGIERGREIVRASIEDKSIPDLSTYEDFYCLECEIACFKKCEKDFLSKECIECSDCFKSCSLDALTEFYLKRKKDAIISAVSYLYSRILVSELDDWVLRRYAIKGSERYSKNFVSEPTPILKLLASELGVRAKFNSIFRVHVSSYLKVAVRLKSPSWSLLNRELRKGYISLSKSDFLRVLEEHLRIKLSAREIVDADFAKEDVYELKMMAARKREKIPRIKFKRIEVSHFPPCMRRILSDLQAGANIPHTARFALTSFLLNLGMDVSEIIGLYKTAPDFDEEKTRYQVEHIAGAKGTEYDTPACETMKTYHNCFRDESCKGVYHPIQYYMREVKAKRERARVVG
jgi:DNA primase large subunit